MDRRDFLVGTGAALGALPLAACTRARPAQVAPAPGAAPPATPEPLTGWAAVRADFDGLAPGLAHMASFFLASHPRPVKEAIERLRRALDDNPLEYLEAHGREHELAVRAAAAEYTGARADDLAFTDSTTMGLGIVYGGVKLAPGQEILGTTHDHIVTTVACTQRVARAGAKYRQVSLYDDPARAEAGAMVERLVAAVKPETRVIAVTWVHSGTGVKLPVRAIADRLARVNAGRKPDARALLVVDGVHGFGLEDVKLPELGCDVFVAGCHKWILGPRGTGLVWATDAAWRAIDPFIPTMDPFWREGPPERMPPAAWLTPGGFHSFEHRWALEVAFRYHLALGKAKVAARLHELNQHVKQELARMPHVRVVTPLGEDLSAGITCFEVGKLPPAEVVARLRQKNVVASVTPPFYPTAYARLAAGLVNLEGDVDAALEAVSALA